MSEVITVKPTSVQLLTGSGGALVNTIDEDPTSLGYLQSTRLEAARVVWSGFVAESDGDLLSAVFSIEASSWPLGTPSPGIWFHAWYARKDGQTVWSKLAQYNSQETVPDLPLGEFLGDSEISTLEVMLYFKTEATTAGDPPDDLWEL